MYVLYYILGYAIVSSIAIVVVGYCFYRFDKGDGERGDK